MSELKTCFKSVDYDLARSLHYIDIGDIGLPDIQRPFVWSNAKVWDLFDSMYRGFPVGYFLFWENASTSFRALGLNVKVSTISRSSTRWRTSRSWSGPRTSQLVTGRRRSTCPRCVSVLQKLTGRRCMSCMPWQAVGRSCPIRTSWQSDGD